MITAKDIPDCTPAEIELPCGWTARIVTRDDEENPEPWTNEDGHGKVREIRYEDYSRIPTGAGERVMHADRGTAWLYDFSETAKVARRDGWGCGVLPAGEQCSRTGKWHRTQREIAACAVEQDFQRMRAWLRGDWSYIGVEVTVTDADGAVVDEESLWGVESDGEYWKDVAADMVNGITAGYIEPNCAMGEETTEGRTK